MCWPCPSNKHIEPTYPDEAAVKRRARKGGNMLASSHDGTFFCKENDRGLEQGEDGLSFLSSHAPSKTHSRRSILYNISSFLLHSFLFFFFSCFLLSRRRGRSRGSVTSPRTRTIPYTARSILLIPIIALCQVAPGAQAAQKVLSLGPLPSVSGANIAKFTFPRTGGGGSFEVDTYISKGDDAPGAQTRQVVIVAHGHREHIHGRSPELLEPARNAKERSLPLAMTNASHDMAARDANNAFKAVQSALKTSGKRDVAIVAPKFFNAADGETSADGDLCIWKGDGWGSGEGILFPALDAIGSFDILDAIGHHFTDKSLYPALESITFAGHSMGSQLMLRHAILGQAPAGLRTSWVVANPSSFLYFDDERPVKDANGAAFAGQNEYKYGFEGIGKRLNFYADASTDPKTLFERFVAREVRFLNGALDNEGVGQSKSIDRRPAAMAQGDNRQERAENYRRHVKRLNGGSDPASFSWQVVPDAKHSASQMFDSQIGAAALFD